MITDNGYSGAHHKKGALTGRKPSASRRDRPNMEHRRDVRVRRRIRTDLPRVEFEVSPVRGDSYSRYLQRIAEIKQSIHLIDQIMHKMPHGPVQAQVPGIIRPKPGRAYAAIESPRGLYSVYVISDGGPNPYRFRMRDPSFISLQAMPKLMPGKLVADTMAVMASLDPVMGGVDK